MTENILWSLHKGWERSKEVRKNGKRVRNGNEVKKELFCGGLQLAFESEQITKCLVCCSFRVRKRYLTSSFKGILSFTSLFKRIKTITKNTYPLWKNHKLQITSARRGEQKQNPRPLAAKTRTRLNSRYRSCARGQGLLCLKLRADEAYGSIQWKMTLKPRLCVKTADNCDKSYWPVRVL